jgi:hypothetical protein
MTLQRATVVYVLGIKSNIFEGRPVTRRFLMRLISSPACAIGRLAKRGATGYFVGCLMTTALFATGCHKAAETTAAPPSAAPAAATADTNQDTQAAAPVSGTIQNPNAGPPTPAPMENPNLAPLAKANGEPDLTALDTALAGWVMGHQRLPKNFTEFAVTSGLAIPRPPPGKKYVITPNMHFQLVNQ